MSAQARYGARNMRRRPEKQNFEVKQTANQPDPFVEDEVKNVSTQLDLMGEILLFCHQKNYSLLIIAGVSKSRPNARIKSIKSMIVQKALGYIACPKEVYRLETACGPDANQVLENKDPTNFRVVVEISSLQDIQRYLLDYLDEGDYKIINFIEKPTGK